jgi:hypothetical protein
MAHGIRVMGLMKAEAISLDPVNHFTKNEEFTPNLDDGLED